MRIFAMPRDLRWDETSENTRVDADKSGQAVRSAWQIMVTRVVLCIGWRSGATMELRLVLGRILM